MFITVMTLHLRIEVELMIVLMTVLQKTLPGQEISIFSLLEINQIKKKVKKLEHIDGNGGSGFVNGVVNG